MRVVPLAAAALAVVWFAGVARADGPCTPAPQSTWGVSATSTIAAPPSTLDTPVARARDLLARAKLLDEQASSDDRVAVDLAMRLPALRIGAKAARDRADHATGDDREELIAHAETLEADVVVSEAEVISRKRGAADNRQTATALRARAIHIVRDGGADTVKPEPPSCDPPFHFTSDGRKVYRIECFR